MKRVAVVYDGNGARCAGEIVLGDSAVTAERSSLTIPLAFEDSDLVYVPLFGREPRFKHPGEVVYTPTVAMRVVGGRTVSWLATGHAFDTESSGALRLDGVASPALPYAQALTSSDVRISRWQGRIVAHGSVEVHGEGERIVLVRIGGRGVGFELDRFAVSA